MVGIHADDVYNNVSGKIATAAAPGTNAAHGDPAYSTTINCNLCHNTVVTKARNKYGSACATACHTTDTDSATNAMVSADLVKTLHVNGTPNVAFANVTMRPKAQVRDDITTVTDLNNTWSRTNGYKVGASSHDASKASLNTGSYAAGSCSSVACHNGNAVSWTAGAISCDKCHTALP